MKAIAKFDGIVSGIVYFESTVDGTEVLFNLRGPSNSTHAIHIHEYGDTRRGCESLGGHWNPQRTTHGSFVYPEFPRHAGDLINNLEFDSRGYFRFSYIDPLIRIADIYGRSVVIHDGIDDLGVGDNAESLITGNAGGRIGCAIIGRCSDL